MANVFGKCTHPSITTFGKWPLDEVGKDACDAVVRGVVGSFDEAQHIAGPGDWTSDLAESLLLLFGRIVIIFGGACRDDGTCRCSLRLVVDGAFLVAVIE